MQKPIFASQEHKMTVEPFMNACFEFAEEVSTKSTASPTSASYSSFVMFLLHGAKQCPISCNRHGFLSGSFFGFPPGQSLNLNVAFIVLISDMTDVVYGPKYLDLLFCFVILLNV